MQYQRRAFDDHAPDCASGRVPGGERRTPGNRWCGRSCVRSSHQTFLTKGGDPCNSHR
jgi:hypothetical protein